MSPQAAFGVSVAFGLAAWLVVTLRYIWPALRNVPRAQALQPILILHSFRFIGLAFIVPGVVSPDLPVGFASQLAYGDLGAAVLALLALAALQSRVGLALVWVFNVWGAADLLNAFYQGNRIGLVPGELGAGFFIVTFLVPLLMITHWLAFRLLLQRSNAPARARESWLPSQ
jgi:hypothetical protein